MIKLIKDEPESKSFDSMVRHPLQSWEWGEARRKMGTEVIRLTDGKNAFQLTLHPIPRTRIKIGYLPRSVMPSREILNFLAEFGEKNQIIFIKIEPYVLKSAIRNPQLENLKFKIKNFKFIDSPHPLFPAWTQILDLTPPEDQLLSNLHHKTRYNIRLAQKKGVSVKEMPDAKGFEIFQELYFKTTERQKYYGHDYLYHKTVWQSLKNKISHLLIAFYGTTPLAAYQLFLFRDVLYYVYGGTSDLHRNLMASNLLMWEAVRFGKKAGAKKFDMWGSLPPGYDHSDPWAGFTRFKEGYGGKFSEFIGSYDLVINPTAYQIYNQLYRLRQAYLKIRRRV